MRIQLQGDISLIFVLVWKKIRQSFKFGILIFSALRANVHSTEVLL